MKPQDLLKTTIQALASNENSGFEEVTHRGNTRKAKIEFGDFRNAQKDNFDGKSLDDEISFLDMETPFISRGDDITYDGNIYNVEYFSPVVQGIYKVYAIKTTRFASSGNSIKVK
jgi:hypothetical protein